MRSARLLPAANSSATAVTLALAACFFDSVKRRLAFNLVSAGLLDEAAHLAASALGLLALARFVDLPRRFYLAALVASVAIDVDHIPPYLGLLPDRGRPFTHSLATVLVFGTAAAISRRHRVVLAGLAAGLILHFARDISEGPPGVRMLWPVSQTEWTGGYWMWIAMIIAFTLTPLVLRSIGWPRSRPRPFADGTPVIGGRTP